MRATLICRAVLVAQVEFDDVSYVFERQFSFVEKMKIRFNSLG